jgi:hypothetical protein
MNRRDFLKTTVALGAAAAIPFTLPEQVEAATPKERFSTGLPQLDELMGGGIRPGELCIVSSDTAGGKTAFCNNVARTNGIKPLDFNPKAGNNDILMLHPAGHGLYIPNYSTPCPKTEHAWEQFPALTRLMKSHAMQVNEAIIWTVPVIMGRLQTVVDSYSFIRSADYYIVCNRKKRRVFLMKNRYGRRGVVPVKFVKSDETHVMCESGECLIV